MKQLLLIPSILLLLVNLLFAHNTFQLTQAFQGLEEKGELYFKCELPERSKINEFSELISIDKVEGREIYAYANETAFNQFLTYNLDFKVLTHPGDIIQDHEMYDGKSGERYDWDRFPTYGAYIEMMEKMARDHPNLCRLYELGKSIRGRKILFAIISDNVNEHEAEPRFMYSSSMHGDETTGYVTLLRLMDHLLTKYNSDNYIKGLVDNIEIWILPDENPDGTYYRGNSSVSGARRANANGVDLNRNYPNPKRNIPNQQHETKMMMRLFDSLHFVSSMNFHGGAELLNYPFDTWTSGNYRNADVNWFNYVCRQFVDRVHQIDRNYMTGENNGVTLGGDWYIIYGSRMDYVTWFRHCREVTGEISYTKNPRGSSLPGYWNKLHKSLLYYIEQCQYGIRGVVKDKNTGKPVCGAKVYARGHDKDSSFVYTDEPHGDFYRPIYQGTYTLEFTHKECEKKTVSNIRVENEKAQVIEVEMDCDFVSNKPVAKIKSSTGVSIVPVSNGVKIIYAISGVVKTGIYDVHGRLIRVFPTNNKGQNFTVWNGLDNKNRVVSPGCYIAKLIVEDKVFTKPFILNR